MVSPKPLLFCCPRKSSLLWSSWQLFNTSMNDPSPKNCLKLSKTLVFYCIPTYPNIILGHASSAFALSLGLNSGLLLWSTMNAQYHIRDFLLHPSLKLQQHQLIHLFIYKHVLTTSHGLQSTMATGMVSVNKTKRISILIGPWFSRRKWSEWQLISCVQLFVTPWAV